MRNLFILYLFFLLLHGCNNREPFCEGHWDIRLNILNKADIGLYIIHSLDYPDTSRLTAIKNYYHNLKYIEAHSKDIKLGICTWDKYFNENVLSDTLMIFVIQSNLNPDEIIPIYDVTYFLNNCQVLKRYDLTLEDLEDLDWTITYP